MPFTVSHVAAVVPLSRLLGPRTSFSALAIGAMVPDLGYYLHSWTLAVHLHTLTGALTSGVAIGVAIFLAFQVLVRPAFVPLLPHWVASRLSAAAWRRGWPPTQPVWAVVVCLAVGAFTHVTWDSVTHLRAGTPWGDWFAAPALSGGWPRYLILQHLSTGFGAVVLVLALGHWARRAQVQLSPGAQRHGFMGHPVLALSLMVVPALVGVGGAAFSLSGIEPLREFVVRVAYFGGASVLCAGLLVGLVAPLLGLGRAR